MLKYLLTFLACAGAIAPLNAKEDLFDVEADCFLHRGFWLPEEAVITGNETLFRGFCDAVQLDFEFFKKTVIDPKFISTPEEIKAIGQQNPHLIREYTQKERDALFVYLNGYNALLVQYAEDLKAAIETQECNHFYFERFKACAVSTLMGIITGSWKSAVISFLGVEIMNYMMDYGAELPFLRDYKKQTDWQFCFAQRIERAYACQVMNLRRV